MKFIKTNIFNEQIKKLSKKYSKIEKDFLKFEEDFKSEPFSDL